MLRIPSFVKTDAPESYGGSMFQNVRTRDMVWEKQDRTKRAPESRDTGLPLGEKAHLSRDAAEDGRETNRSSRSFSGENRSMP